MKSVAKRIMSLVLACLILQIIVLPCQGTYASSGKLRDFVEKELAVEGRTYLSSRMKQIESVLYSCNKELNVSKKECDEVVLGDPFVVYNEEEEVQEQILHYPIVAEDTKRVLAVVSLMNTTVGWQYSIDTNWADKLNRIGYAKNDDDYVFYISADEFIAEKSNSNNQNSSQNSLFQQEFDDKSFESKKQIIKARMKNWRKIDVEENRKAENRRLQYSPTITNELGYYYCNLSGAQGQGNYKLCWAASVATVVNYRKGTSYTAKNIANTMGIGYNTGGTPYQMASALSNYGLNYSELYSTINFSSVMSEVNQKYPFIICAYPSGPDEGHAVTAYGYRNLEDGKYVILWNSAINSGNGGVTISLYNSSGLTFSMNNTSFTWTYTVKANHVSYK